MFDATEGLLEALSSPPWSLVVLILGLALIFRNHIPGMAARIKRLKLPGFEIELHESLEQLRKDAEQAASAPEPTTHALSGTAEGKGEATGRLEVKTRTQDVAADAVVSAEDSATIHAEETASVQKSDDTEAIVAAILDEAASDPKVALIRLSIEIEKELRIILGRAGFLAGQRYIPLPKALKIIETDYKVLSLPVISAIQSFWRVRNQIIHGGEGNRNNVLSAIDSGLMVFKTLRQQPCARFFVLQANLPVYADEAGTKVRDDLKALVLEEVGAGGLVRTKHLVLTTRSHYKPRMEIAWEWDMNHQIEAPVWRRDPDTGEMVGSNKYGPMEFIGRDIADFRAGN